MFLDFHKAFDLVDPHILIEKLSLYKFSSLSLNWVRPFLECWKQTIKTDSGLGDFWNILSGVPQGSILGPTLFLLFINHLPLHFEYCLSDFYADDATVHKNYKNIDTIGHKLQTELGNANTCGKQNKLPVSYSKTACMILGCRPPLKECRQLNLKTDNTDIQNVNAQHYLDFIWINSYLGLNTLITYALPFHQNITIKTTIWIYSNCSKKTFYQGFILQLIDYGSITRGTTSSANLERLTKLQKRAARIILKKIQVHHLLKCSESLGSLQSTKE